MLVNSEMKDNCHFCPADQGEETLNKECVKGLWLKIPTFQEEPEVSHDRVSS